MIPTIGVMIGAYIGLRCIEIALRPGSAFSSNLGRGVVVACALLVFVLAGFSTLELMLSGTKGLGGVTP